MVLDAKFVRPEQDVKCGTFIDSVINSKDETTERVDGICEVMSWNWNESTRCHCVQQGLQRIPC